MVRPGIKLRPLVSQAGTLPRSYLDSLRICLFWAATIPKLEEAHVLCCSLIKLHSSPCSVILHGYCRPHREKKDSERVEECRNTCQNSWVWGGGRNQIIWQQKIADLFHSNTIFPLRFKRSTSWDFKCTFLSPIIAVEFFPSRINAFSA